MSSVALHPASWPATLPPASLLDTPVSDRDLADLHALHEADRQTYDFVAAPSVPQILRAVVEYGWDGEVPITYVVRAGAHAGPGTDPVTIVASMQIWYSTYDNLSHAYVEPVVLPSWRRRGIGSALVELGESWARTNGRVWVMSSTREGAANEEFAERRGYVRALREVLRRQVLADVDPDLVARELAAAREAATEYELIRSNGPLPDELMTGLLEVELAMNDAPREGSAWEDEIPSVERLRASERGQQLRGTKRYTVIARRRSDGAVAGQTTISLHPDAPTYGHQQITAVARGHRGHRLGMLLKADMLTWLAEAEPQLETIDTDNAGSNDHMIAINDKLGYRISGAVWERQKHLDP